MVTVSVSPWRSFATGAWTNLLNPKIGMFYIATIPQFLVPAVPAAAMGAMLAGEHAILTLLWFTLLITGAHIARRWIANERVTKVIDRGAGTLLIGFGVLIVAESF